MPIDTSLVRTDLLAILAVLAERRLEFVRHGPQRAAQLQESHRRPAPHPGEVEREAQQMQRVAELVAEGSETAPPAPKFLIPGWN